MRVTVWLVSQMAALIYAVTVREEQKFFAPVMLFIPAGGGLRGTRLRV